MNKILQIETAFRDFILRLNPSINESAEIAVRLGKVLDEHIKWKLTFEITQAEVYGESVKSILAEYKELQKIKEATALAAKKNPSAYETGTSVDRRETGESEKGHGE